MIAAVLSLAIAVVLSATLVSSARPTRAQKLFASIILADESLSPTVRESLRTGGFVERKIKFVDFSGDGKVDALVKVNSSGAAGVIAIYALSALDDADLGVVYAVEDGYQLDGALSGSRLTVSRAAFRGGDPVCCPSKVSRNTLEWNARKKTFTRAR